MFGSCMCISLSCAYPYLRPSTYWMWSGQPLTSVALPPVKCPRYPLDWRLGHSCPCRKSNPGHPAHVWNICDRKAVGRTEWSTAPLILRCQCHLLRPVYRHVTSVRLSVETKSHLSRWKLKYHYWEEISIDSERCVGGGVAFVSREHGDSVCSCLFVTWTRISSPFPILPLHNAHPHRAVCLSVCLWK
jgi:hypothetical protein